MYEGQEDYTINASTFYVLSRYAPRACSFLNSYMKLGDCALCCQKFPLNDIVVSFCRHVYHPFCFLSHFKVATVCADPRCGAKMPVTWLKSFGVTELDMNLYD